MVWASFACPAFSNPLCSSLFTDNLELKYHKDQLVEEDSANSTRRFNIYLTNFEGSPNSSIHLNRATKGTITELKINEFTTPETILYIANNNINKDFGRSPGVLKNEFESGVKFIEESHGVLLKIKPDQNIKVSFFIERTRKKSGVTYLPSGDKTDWLETRSVEVQSNNEGYVKLPWGNKNFPDWVIESGSDRSQYLFSIGLRIKKLQSESRDLKLFLDGPIAVDYSLNNSRSAQMIYDLFQRKRFGILDGSDYRKITKKFISKVLTNLYSAENILYARRTLEKGIDEVDRQIQALNLDIYFLINKTTAVDFFELIKGGFVPIERGEFKEYHGEYSHALQVLAMTRGMSASEKKEFQEFYKILHFNEPGWIIWNLLFDSESPGEPINPQFWRD